MERPRIWIVVIIAAVLVIGGLYSAYMTYRGVQAQEPPKPTMETGTVTQGDIVITVDGSGELIPASELELCFRASGVLDEVLVETGDRVAEDDVLARLETDDLERAVAEADVQLQIAQLELADVREGPSEAELADAEVRVRDAQTQLSLAYDAYQDATDDSTDDAVESAKVMYDWWVGYYQSQKAKYEEGNLSRTKHDYAMAAMIEAEEAWERAKNEAEIDEVQALKSVEQAQNALLQAEEDLELLRSEPLTDTLTEAELAVDEANLALEEACLDLEAAELYAPFDGTVMSVDAAVGERVGVNATILTVADLEEPLLQFWLEESDMSRVAVGNQVNVTFEALPDTTCTGKLVNVDPVLVSVSGTTAVQAEASLHLDAQNITLLSGMTADVEVISAEARNAVIVPMEALKETEEGGYAVTVVRSSGEMEDRRVEVGIKDAVNAEILSGLEMGETVRIDG
ncbi:MAG: efflux RND transporter periplasmic adaptor subunit [Anaerolineae bacterium]|jgi:HlyD family secretion protein